MKKLFALLLVLATVIPASSQILTSRTFGEKKKSPTTWYVRAGLSMNSLTGPAIGAWKDAIKENNEEDAGRYVFENKFGTRLGYDFEVGFRKNFGKTNLYWGMEAGFGTRGGTNKGSETEVDDDDPYKEEWGGTSTSYTFKLMPLQIGYLLPLSNEISLDPHLGIYASVDMADKSKCWEMYDDEKDWDDYTKDAEFQRFDLGLKLGIGVWYDRFNLDFSWQRGFMTYMKYFPFDDYVTDKHGEEKYFQSSNLILSLGVSF